MGLQVWAKPINGRQSKERAVVLFNRSSAAANMSAYWKDINLLGSANVQDLWEHTDLGSIDSVYTVNVPSHSVVVLKVTGDQSRMQEVFEGENSWINNYNLTNNTERVANQGVAISDNLCSGGAKAGWIGNGSDNYIEWRYLYTDTEGYYNCTLTYESGEDRNATISINGLDTLLSNLYSGGWAILKDVTFPVKLTKGYNTIRISNTSSWLPNIDKIKIHLYKDEPITNIKDIDRTKKISKVFPNPCFDNIRIETDAQIEQVDIYSLLGIKQLSSKLSAITTSKLTPGIYILRIFTDEGYDTHLIAKQ